MYKKHSTYPLFDTTNSLDAKKGQLSLKHNVDRRLNAIVTAFERGSLKVEDYLGIKNYLNRTLKANFNDRHITYALEVLDKHKVLGKKFVNGKAVYYRLSNTAARWARARAVLQGKK